MKEWIILAAAIAAAYFAGEEWAKADACNQKMYDQVYKAIIVQAIQSRKPATESFKERNDSIENLRALCKGQLSTYERPSKKQ